jgi:hypothetical protein
MTERPILFNAPMVRAILNGSKTQTRRVVKGMALLWLRPDGFTPEFTALPENGLCPYGQPGDRLWVRETFQRFTDDGEILYKADPAGFEAMNEYKRDECLEARWRPSIHMPRQLSRITLEITAVRVERLQEISEADAMAEGIPHSEVSPPDMGRFTFRHLWESINGPGSWDSNPWVWVIEFRRVEV